MMKKIRKSVLSQILCLMLIAAMAFSIIGCGQTTSAVSAGETAANNTEEMSAVSAESVEFTFDVVYADGTQDEFVITTDAETVGDALTAEGLIEGEPGDYGLYVKTVNGVTADYNVDGTYWAFYINGEYASTGVDSTPVEAGAIYAFKVEK